MKQQKRVTTAQSSKNHYGDNPIISTLRRFSSGEDCPGVQESHEAAISNAQSWGEFSISKSKEPMGKSISLLERNDWKQWTNKSMSDENSHPALQGLWRGLEFGRGPPEETSRLRPTRRPWSSLRNLKCSSAGTKLIWYSSSSVVGPSPNPPSSPPPLPELEAIVWERGTPFLSSVDLGGAAKARRLGRWNRAGRRRP